MQLAGAQASMTMRRLTRAGSRGFTLIELMVTIAVAAILMAIAVPSFTSLINSNRLTSAANEMVAAVQTARLEAVRTRRPVTICTSADGLTCDGFGGILVFADRNNDGSADTSEVLRIGVVSPKVVTDKMKVVFRPDGFAKKGDGALENGVYRFCIVTDKPAQNIRRVHLVAGSRVSVTTENGQGQCK